MSFDKYEFDDFVMDESFQSWALGEKDDDIEFWNYWISNNQGKEQTALEARSFLLKMNLAKAEELPSEHIESVILKTQKFIDKSNRKVFPYFSVSKYMRIAAAIALLLASIQATFWYVSDIHNQRIVSSSNIEFIEKVNPKGQKLTVTLKDGTAIKLNSNSKLRFPPEFDGDSRTVYLEGEAFFEVARDESKPFHVITNDIKVTVLGTSFNVQSSAQGVVHQVAVATGKVAVSSVTNKKSKQRTILIPNEMVTFDPNTNQMVKTNYNQEEVLGWREGLLYFNNLPIIDIASKLENWYGVDITIENTVDTTERYNGKFKNESLENILDALMYAKGASYKISGDHIYLY